MNESFDLQEYLSKGIENFVAEALNSSLFRALRENGHLLEDHAGGCVLYEKRDLVEALLAQSR